MIEVIGLPVGMDVGEGVRGNCPLGEISVAVNEFFLTILFLVWIVGWGKISPHCWGMVVA